MPEDDETRLHALFAELRAQVYDVVEGFSTSVLDRIERERDADRGPGIGHLLGSTLVELANVLSSATGQGKNDDDDDADPPPDDEG